MAPLAGRFTYRPATDSWTWSEGMFRLHGYEPGEVVPTTALVMHHMHPEDVEAAWDSRNKAMEDGQPIVFPHRIHPAKGPMRTVIAAGHVEEGDRGLLLTGHLIEVVEGSDEEFLRPHVDQVLEDFTEHRAAIEQAKGVLMQLVRIDAATAGDVLRVYAGHARRPVRAVAESLVAAATNDETPSKDASRVDVVRTLDALLRDSP